MLYKDEIIIQAKKLAGGYGNRVLWDKADFEVERGEFIGLLGPNGAGKTTLLRIILGILAPIQGNIELFGQPPAKGNPRIGYVPQRRVIDGETKIEALEYVRLGLVGNLWGTGFYAKAKEEREKAAAALKLVDAEELAHRSLSELSGGEIQRVFLAQALVSSPELLLLDEPLANLDIRRESQLIKTVNKIVRAQNITAILIAHDINPILPFVNRIIYVANNKLVSGKPQDIVNSETLSKLYNAPIEVLRDSKGRLAVLGVEEAVHHG